MKLKHLLLSSLVCAHSELFTKSFLNGSYYSLAFPFGLVLKQYVFEESDPLGVEPFVQIAGSPDVPLPLQRTVGVLDEISVVAQPAHKTPAVQDTTFKEAVLVACATQDVLLLVLQEGVLENREGRVAAVDGDHLLEFDVQDHVTYGWSVNCFGELSLQGLTLFYQCHAGASYKLYDAPVSLRCMPVLLDVVELVDCR